MEIKSSDPSNYEENLDLKEFIKILLKNSKFIIVFILIFTLFSYIFIKDQKPLFRTSTLIEIGYIQMQDGEIDLIEKADSLISNMKVNLIHKNDGNISVKETGIKTIENRLIELNLTSQSPESIDKATKKYINFILERHSKLLNTILNLKSEALSLEIERKQSQLSNLISLKRSGIKNQLSDSILDLELIETEISSYEKLIIETSKNLDLIKKNPGSTQELVMLIPIIEQDLRSHKVKKNALQNKRLKALNISESLNKELDLLDNNVFESEKFFEISEQLNRLEHELEKLNKQKAVQTNVIGETSTSIIKPKKGLIIFLSTVAGFFISILLVFLKIFVSNFRSNKA